MRTRNTLKLGFLLPFALALAAACGDGEKEKAPPADSGPGFTDEDADVAPDSGEELDGGVEVDAEVDTDAAQTDAAISCTGKDGCYSCKPETNEQLLNSCAEGCRKFDVKSYPSSWKPGQALPALP